ncbi:hypothetical protein LCGC14_2236750 [marine sediment metagenome]|uniref:Uncharacterized protein n=1 Tax=marine sediment metagenome TaxID=412755 RepID=A0A0F9D6W3_9ZZZZ|nr:hypothetical protein [Methylophaga sp.]HEC59012.1 hypothetical protein [Methylophaga sp.]
MVEIPDIPTPSDTGADGQQIQGSNDIPTELMEPSQLSRFPMVNAIEGLAAANNRVFGSEATSKMLVATTSHFAGELSRSQDDTTRLRQQIDILRDEKADISSRNAVLNERIASFRSNRHFSNFGIFAGTTLIGACIEFFQNDMATYGIPVMILGTILLFLSWFIAPRRGDQ